MPNPPKLLHRFFRWFCHPDLREDIEGDLLETFEEKVKSDGSKKAKWRFFKDVLQLFRPEIIRPTEGIYRLNQYGMFQNHVKSAWRNLLKRKKFSALNIVGLSIGMASCLIILQFIRFEKSYDQFHPDIENIYRLTLEMNGSENSDRNIQATNHPAAGPAMKADYPQVEEFARLISLENFNPAYSLSYVTADGQVKTYYEEKVFFADPSFLTMFNYPLVEGNIETVLQEPNTAIISQAMADKYFRDINPIGEVITLVKRFNYKITGIFKETPENSHLKFEVLISFASLKEVVKNVNTQWKWPSFYTYVKLAPHADLEDLTDQTESFVNKYLGDINKEYGLEQRMQLQPLADIHLHSQLQNETEKNGSYETVAFLSLLALMILLIAWINYVNLSTSRSIERAGEVGIRKVVGANKANLISQFFVESFMINLMAISLALVMVDVATPAFNSLMGKQFFSGITSLEFWSQASNWLILGSMLIGGGLLAGIYPALVLSSYRPIKSLSKLRSTQKISLRPLLVVFQFCVTFIFIVGTLIVFSQLRFMQNKDLGFNMDQILVIKSPKIAKNLKLNLYDSTYHVRVGFLKKELLREVNIHYFSRSSDIPGRTFQKATTFKKKEQNMEDGTMAFNIYVDEDYLPAYEMELIAGRNFSKDMVSDKEAVIVNEMVVEQLGYKSPQDAIGQMATMNRGGFTNVRIIGVTKNINSQSLAHKQSPMIFAYVVDVKAKGSWGDANYYSLKIKTEDLSQTIIKAENTFKEIFPNDPFDYFFLDDHFNEQYKADQQFGKIFGIFASLAIIVACLGLFGLVSYVSSTRTKEIGIRKVMGASTMQILTLLSKQFVKLLIIAAILAVPISWWGGDSWLSNYAYRIEIDGWLFATATLIVFSIALFTVLWQSISTANANPVDSLRDE